MANKASKGDKTRQRILTEAIRLFSKHGFEETSFQMIADECEISQSIPVYHFGTKSGLFEAAVIHCQEQSQKIIAGDYDVSDDAYGRLKKVCLGTFNWTNVYRSQAELHLLLAYFAAIHEPFISLYQNHAIKIRSEIEGILLAGKREGAFKYIGDSKLLAESIQEMVLGMCINFLAGRTLSKLRDLEKKVDQALHFMVGYKQ